MVLHAAILQIAALTEIMIVHTVREEAICLHGLSEQHVRVLLRIWALAQWAADLRI